MPVFPQPYCIRCTLPTLTLLTHLQALEVDNGEIRVSEYIRLFVGYSNELRWYHLADDPGCSQSAAGSAAAPSGQCKSVTASRRNTDISVWFWTTALQSCTTTVAITCGCNSCGRLAGVPLQNIPEVIQGVNQYTFPDEIYRHEVSGG